MPVAAQPRAGGPAAGLVTEEFRGEAADPGVRLYVRNKHPEDLKRTSSERTLLFVHGATQPAEATFDLSLDGVSWMGYIARQGWDVYLMDIRGYGGSTRPPEMDQPAENNPPLVRTDVAVQDVGAVVDFIRRRRAAQRINLMGWSWGTVLMAAYACEYPDWVSSLVLYAPVWLATSRQPAQPPARSLGAYVAAPMATARDRLQAGAPADRKAELMPPSWFEAWSAAALATDPVGARQTPPVLRSPAGGFQDIRDYWDAGKSYYDPGRITVPTLIAAAEWDGVTPDERALALFHRLGASPRKRFVEIGEATHFASIEKNRMRLFREVQFFLDEVSPLS